VDSVVCQQKPATLKSSSSPCFLALSLLFSIHPTQEGHKCRVWARGEELFTTIHCHHCPELTQDLG
jgi:hypothetical protein